MKKAKKELQMEKLTSPQIKTLVNQGYKTAIIPTGAVEQHGPHLPMLLDAEHASWQGIKVAENIKNALVAPAIRIGSSEHHIEYSGTISLRQSTFKAICEDYCLSLKQHGFDTIYLFSCHGGNFSILKDIEPQLNSLVGAQVKVICFSDFELFIKTWRLVAEEWGERKDKVGGHAGLAESSISLVLFPELVHLSSLEKGNDKSDLLDNKTSRILFEDGIHALSENGILGNPIGMDKKLGLLCLEAYTEVLTNFFYLENKKK